MSHVSDASAPSRLRRMIAAPTPPWFGLVVFLWFGVLLALWSGKDALPVAIVATIVIIGMDHGWTLLVRRSSEGFGGSDSISAVSDEP